MGGVTGRIHSRAGAAAANALQRDGLLHGAGSRSPHSDRSAAGIMEASEAAPLSLRKRCRHASVAVVNAGWGDMARLRSHARRCPGRIDRARTRYAPGYGVRSVIVPAWERFAETERYCGARVVVGQLRIFRDVLAHRIGHLLRPDVGRQAEILADARPRGAADRIDGVLDAVGSALDVGRARRPRLHVRLRAQPIEIAAREGCRSQRHGERRGTKHSPQHGVPYINAARDRLLQLPERPAPRRRLYASGRPKNRHFALFCAPAGADAPTRTVRLLRMSTASGAL